MSCVNIALLKHENKPLTFYFTILFGLAVGGVGREFEFDEPLCFGLRNLCYLF
jgi:hypothetical protein